MARYMITHSLLSSWLYLLSENPYEDATSTRDNFAEFLGVLNRLPTVPTEAMQNGIDFEDCVTDVLKGRPVPDNWSEAATNIANRIRGGVLQFKAKKTVTVRGMEILLYGRLDVLHAGTIFDIKFTKNYDAGKYFDSTQHPMYFEIVPEANDFVYLASNGSAVWPEHYTREETPSILPTTSDFLDWLDTMRLMGTFKEKWLAL